MCMETFSVSDQNHKPFQNKRRKGKHAHTSVIWEGNDIKGLR